LNENVEIIFCSYICQKWIDYIKSRPSDHRPILHTSSNTFNQRNASLLW